MKQALEDEINNNLSEVQINFYNEFKLRERQCNFS